MSCRLKVIFPFSNGTCLPKQCLISALNTFSDHNAVDIRFVGKCTGGKKEKPRSDVWKELPLVNKLQALIIKNIQFRVQWKRNCKSMLDPGTVPTVIVHKSMGKIQQLRTCPNTLRLQQGKQSVAQTNGWKRIHFPMFIFWIKEISGRIKSRLGIYESQRLLGLRNC